MLVVPDLDSWSEEEGRKEGRKEGAANKQRAVVEQKRGACEVKCAIGPAGTGGLLAANQGFSGLAH